MIWHTLLVVPYVGTWIEILMSSGFMCHMTVVPYVGTWIEIAIPRLSYRSEITSFPTWERG